MIELFLQTGMRLSELAKLTLSDIDIPKRITADPDNTGSVRVRRKGGKTEYIPLNHKACKPLPAIYRCGLMPATQRFSSTSSSNP